MGNEAQKIVQPESDGSDLTRPAFAHITIQPQDLRPCSPRRWSATAIAAIWPFDDPSFGSYYLRARSKKKLVAKAIKMLRRNALRVGIDNPVILVTDAPVVSSSAGMRQAAVQPRNDFDRGGAASAEANHQVEVISAGAGHG